MLALQSLRRYQTAFLRVESYACGRGKSSGGTQDFLKDISQSRF
jgi:hypothetical protein